MENSEKIPNVLVVEDEAILLFTLADDLRDLDFAVLEATSADKALVLLESDAKIDVLITDIDMPGTMDGLGLAGLVYRRWPPIKIIVTSGKRPPAKDTMPDAALFIPKPYEPGRLAKTIRELLAA